METNIDIIGNSIFYGYRIVWTDDFHTYTYKSGLYFNSYEDAYDGALVHLSN